MNTSHHSRTRRGRLVAGAALATAAVLVALSVPSVASAAESDTTIDIVDINDFHGRIESEGTTADKAAGAARLANVVQAYREANPNTIFTSAGDNVGASTFTSLIQQDTPTIEALNAMGLDVSAIGNHELDKGQTDFIDRIEEAAAWQYVSANIVQEGTTTPAFEPFKVVEKDGVKVGFIGATTEDLIPGLVSPGGVEGLAMAPIVGQVNRYAEQLKDGDPDNGEADVLVLLVHEGAASNTIADVTGTSRFAQIAAGVDERVSAIVSAHTHFSYDHEVAGPTGKLRPVIQTGSYGMNYGHLQLTVDSAKQLTNITAEVKPVNTDPLVPTNTQPAQDVAKIVADAKTVADEKGAQKLGTVTGDLRRAVQSDRTSENRGGESVLGNNIAEVQRAATERNGSQVAFMNPGGLRTDILYASSGANDADGVVTYKEAALVQPFANTLVTEDMTGQQIKDALEQQWQPDGADRPFLKLGVSNGFAYTYDPSKGRGERITTMTLNGKPIALTDTLKVTVNSFLSTGGDKFSAFTTGRNIADSGQVDLQAQVDYFTANPVVTPPTDQRAVGVTVTPTPADGFQPGDEVTVRLSSLVFSSDEPAEAGSVSISADGDELASSAIDPTIEDTTDEQGKATLTFRVPGGEDEQADADQAGVARSALTTRAAATTDEPLVVTLPNGQTITLAVTIPVAAETEDPGTDPGTDPTDPADPGTTPGAGTVGAVDGGAGTGVDTDGDGTVDVVVADDADGELAFTGAEFTGPAIAAGLLFLAGIAGLVVARRGRALRVGAVTTD